MKKVWNNKKIVGWLAIISFGIYYFGEPFKFGGIFIFIALFLFGQWIGLDRRERKLKKK